MRTTRDLRFRLLGPCKLQASISKRSFVVSWLIQTKKLRPALRINDIP